MYSGEDSYLFTTERVSPSRNHGPNLQEREILELEHSSGAASEEMILMAERCRVNHYLCDSWVNQLREGQSRVWQLERWPSKDWCLHPSELQACATVLGFFPRAPGAAAPAFMLVYELFAD